MISASLNLTFTKMTSR